MTDSYVQLQTDGAGKKVETEQLVDGLGNTVERQVVAIDGEYAFAILEALMRIVDKLPRVDAFDRLVTNPSEIAPATTPISGSITTVTSVTALGDLNRINRLGGSAATAQQADNMPTHAANAGSMHLYNLMVWS